MSLNDHIQQVPADLTTAAEKRRQLQANRRHARNAWLGRIDESRYAGDDGSFLDLLERADWPAPAEGAYVAFLATLDAAHAAAKTSHDL